MARVIQPDPLSALRIAAENNPPVAAEPITEVAPLPVEKKRDVFVPAVLQPSTTKFYTVRHKRVVSWFSQMITLHPGDRISEASHGPYCIERLRDAGVEFIEVE